MFTLFLRIIPEDRRQQHKMLSLLYIKVIQIQEGLWIMSACSKHNVLILGSLQGGRWCADTGTHSAS